MKNIKLELMYDGTRYHGFQRQKNAITVQECIENAIEHTCREKTSITGCSRTDAGVHASMYVANFFSETSMSCYRLPIALNSMLDDDIRITKAEYVPLWFNARRDSVQKTYRYKIINKKENDVFLRHYGWFFPSKLDMDEMKKAAEYFLGSHDFSSFMTAGGKVKTYARDISELRIEKKDDIIDIYITASGFLYNMVRIIAGTLVYVGKGKIKALNIPDIINSHDRTQAGMTAPPEGLMLIDIKY